MSTIIAQLNPSTGHDDTKKNILSRLLENVKQCQIRYGGKTQLASERDTCIIDLCNSLEVILSHGLRHSPLTFQLRASTLKQVSNLITSKLNIGNDGQVFWHYVIIHLTKHERERYTMLRHVCSDIGRGRAWIRGALNERSLERYFHCLLGSEELLEAYYEDWAFMRDQEKSCMLTTMAAGLNSILFAMNIDNPGLNGTTSNSKSFMVNCQNEPVIVTSLPTNVNHKINRRAVKQIISFEDNDDDISIDSTLSSASSSNLNKSVLSDSVTGSFEHCVEIQSSEKNVTSESVSGIKDNVLTPITEVNVNLLIPVAETSEVTVNEELPFEDINTESDYSDNTEYSDPLSKIEYLKRENNKLKSQLKLYVSAVQMLKNDGNKAHKALVAITGNVHTVDYHEEVQQYEAKLIQVAEMHAELMEFNEHLLRQINHKDFTITKLRKELQDVRGPNLSDEYDITGDVAIWIPSAFLTGSNSDVHHVYQVYIKAGMDEWNIYRRYSQFYSLHCDLKKLDSAVAQFDFPPKKTVGNKDVALVEKRRRKLQAYLRRVFHYWPELASCSSRSALQQHLAFFRDSAVTEKKQKRNSIFVSGSSSRNSSSSNSETHYNGL